MVQGGAILNQHQACDGLYLAERKERLTETLRAGLDHIAVLLCAVFNAENRHGIVSLIGLLRRCRDAMVENGLPGMVAELDAVQDLPVSESVSTESLRAVDAVAALFPCKPFRYCLRRSCLLYHLLYRGGMHPSLVLGVRRGTTNSPLEGHAWIEVENEAYREHSDLHQAMHVIFRHPGDDTDATGRVVDKA